MTEVHGPWDGTPGTFGEDQWSAMFSRIAPSGVFGSPETADLLPYADSSGMQVKVRVGYGIVNGQYYQNTAEKIVPIVNGEGNDRIDVIVLQRNASTNQIIATVHKGTASATPIPPVLTADEIPLAQVLVKAGRTTSIAVSECTDWRLFAARSTRPALDHSGVDAFDLYSGDGLTGDIVVRDNALWYWSADGGAWAKLQGQTDTGWQTCITTGGFVGTTPGGYPPSIQARTINNVSYLRGYPIKTLAGTPGTSYKIAQIPALVRWPPYVHRYATVMQGTSIGDLYIGVDGSINILIGPDGLTAARGFPVDTSWLTD